MKEEKKKAESEKKIVIFDIDESVMTDDEIDRFLAESLQKEADDLETELNQDPVLLGADISDAMFQSIVRQLKEQGLWEEEEASGSEADTPQEEVQKAEVVMQQDEVQDPEVALRQEEVQDPEVALRQEEVQNPEVALRQEEVQDPEVALQQEEVQDPEVALQQEEVQDPEVALQQTEKQDEKNTEDEGRVGEKEREISDAQQHKSEVPQNLEELYAMLPEDDRRALALGKQIEKKKETRAVKSKRRRKVVKYSGVAAAVLVLVFSGSMMIEANRRLVKKAWDGVMYNLGFRVSTNYTGEEENVRSKTNEEIEAMKKINEVLDIPAISFEYMPKEMEYLNYEIMEDNTQAVVFYNYQEKIFSVTMIDRNIEGVSYYVVDNQAVLRDSVTNEQNVKVDIKETNENIDRETYIAEMEYKGYRYILNGMISLEEIKKIAENIIFL